MDGDTILAQDALGGRTVALSVSQSPDLDRLGLTEAHLRLVLGEIARTVVTGGGLLAYGGDLRQGGYTTFLAAELGRHFHREKLIRLYLAWPVHRAMSVERLRATPNELPVAARPIYLDLDGRVVDPLAGRGSDPLTVTEEDQARGLSAMRAVMTDECHARVLIGGRRLGYSGRLPGLVEEALLALKARQPLYLAAGFGGTTLGIAGALGMDVGWASTPGLPPATGLADLVTLAARPGWRMPSNGLNDDENRRLTSSYRPGEIAALIGLGMGRLGTGRAAPGG